MTELLELLPSDPADELDELLRVRTLSQDETVGVVNLVLRDPENEIVLLRDAFDFNSGVVNDQVVAVVAHEVSVDCPVGAHAEVRTGRKLTREPDLVRPDALGCGCPLLSSSLDGPCDIVVEPGAGVVALTDIRCRDERASWRCPIIFSGLGALTHMEEGPPSNRVFQHAVFLRLDRDSSLCRAASVGELPDDAGLLQPTCWTRD